MFLVGAKSLGAYGGYETFINKLTEYHQNKANLKYHVACKANGDGHMDETKVVGAVKISDTEFTYHNAHCFKMTARGLNEKTRLIETCREYCTGCGLCGAVNNKKFTEDEKHFLYPNLGIEDYELCKTVCPAAGNAVNNYSDGSIWGTIRHVRLD